LAYDTSKITIPSWPLDDFEWIQSLTWSCTRGLWLHKLNLHFCKMLEISLILINHWLKWLAASLAWDIKAQTLIITTEQNQFRSENSKLPPISLSLNLDFLHTNTKNYCIFLIIIIHWSRIIICLDQLSQNSSSSCTRAWRWKFEIEADSSVFNHSFLLKASRQGQRSRSGAFERLRARIQQPSLQGDSKFIISFCCFLDIDV
jgi:hypothetical protein